MNVYKFLLLEQLPLIEDIKNIIRHYTKIRIIKPPVVIFETDEIVHIHDNIRYLVTKMGLYEPSYRHTAVYVNNNNEIRDIIFYYSGIRINVDLDNISNVKLYKQYNKHKIMHGLYYIHESPMFIVDTN